MCTNFRTASKWGQMWQHPAVQKTQLGIVMMSKSANTKVQDQRDVWLAVPAISGPYHPSGALRWQCYQSHDFIGFVNILQKSSYIDAELGWLLNS